MKKVKKGYVFALAAIMLLPCLRIMQAQAAGGVEIDKDCSLTVSVEVNGSEGSNEDYLADFNNMTIPVSVYRVAVLADTTGQKFEPVDAFEKMDFSLINGKDSLEVAAEKWKKLAEDAAEILTKNSAIEPAGTAEVKCPAGGTIAAGEITGLKTGMYLVVPEACYNPDYTVQYVFAPYLTTLPSSEYALTGMGKDEWLYETAIGLKPEAQPQYGKLKIIKNLKRYNATLGPATFVFQIVGTDKAGVTKYDEVASLTVEAAGSNTITVENIPAGLDITVTEVYSGASYRIEDPTPQTTVIWSEAAVDAGAAQEASVSFTNDYSGGNRSGYGVTNHFESDGAGGWKWENPTTPAEE